MKSKIPKYNKSLVKQPFFPKGRIKPKKRPNLNNLPEETIEQALKRGVKIQRIKR